jgi:hypothetical protein
MATCLFSKGRKKGCKDAISGVLNVYFINDLDPANITKDVNGIITAVTGSPSAYKYELRADAEFTQTINNDKQAGTTVFEQKLAIALHQMDATSHKEIKLLAYSSPRIIVETNDGKFHYMGEIRACDMTSGSINSGKALTDFNGYNLEFTATEGSYAPFLNAAPATIGFTVVQGV